MVRNAHWYNRNETRSWPIDETATFTDDDGVLLPSNIICDLRLTFPRSVGPFAFISNVAVTPRLVTVAIFACDRAINPSLLPAPSPPAQQVGTTPIAFVTVPKPLVVYRNYKIEPLINAVGGWIAFGLGANDLDNVNAKFSTPQQSILAAGVTVAMPSPAITSIGKYGDSKALTGLVRLLSNDRSRVRAVLAKDREYPIPALENSAFAAAVIQSGGQLASGVHVSLNTENNENALREFAGPCGGRPESGSCGPPEPIQRINSVRPGCDGIVTLDFTGCAKVAKIVTGAACGALIDCGFELIDACEADALPDEDGNLPNDPESLCPE